MMILNIHKSCFQENKKDLIETNVEENQFILPTSNDKIS